MGGSFHLGDWLVQPETGRITKHGQTVRVRAKVMDLLVFLARRPGEVVSKDRLIEAVWGGEALSDSALTRSMAELRHSLDDDAERPTLIETIPKRGYRVIAPVYPDGAGTEHRTVDPAPAIGLASPGRDESRDVAAPGPEIVALIPAGQRPRASGRRVVLAAAVGTLIGLVAMGVVPGRRPAPDPQIVRYFLPAPEGTTFAAFATEPQPAISPDGRYIATVATARDTTRAIWIQSLDALSARELAGTGGASSPFWSPDGRWIAFFADGKLKRVRLSGGPPETICVAAGGFGGAWSSNGVVLFALNRTSGLYRVAAEGGDPVMVTTLDATREETSHRFPQFLPDGTHYVFLVRSNQPEHRGIFLGSLASADRRRLTSTDSNVVLAEPGYLLHVRGSVLLAQAFNVNRKELTGDEIPLAEGLVAAPTVRSAPFAAAGHVLAYRPGGMLKTQLLWVDRSGRPLGNVGAPARYLTAALAPDGKRLAVDLLDFASGAIDTWITDLSRGVPYRFTAGESLNGYPLWTPDGRRIIFASNRKGKSGLYEKDVNEGTPDGGGNHGTERMVQESDTDRYPQAISADGQSILYVEHSDATGYDVWLARRSGPEKPVAVLQSPFNETHPQLSPDGRWLAYTSDESGRLEVYVRSFPASGGKWRVSTEGGCQPRWRADGKELFYVHLRDVMSVPIVSGPSFKPALPTRLFSTHAGRTSVLSWDYVVAAEGQRFLIKDLVFDESGSPMVVVLNWQGLLRR